MGKSRPPYPAEFRQQMIELVRSGRTPADLSREFECSAQTIANWVAQEAIDRGKPLTGKEGLSSAEREELNRLRWENRQLKVERDILANYGLVRQERRSDIHAIFELVMANRADVNVRTMCRILKVSAAGYYGRRNRAPSRRRLANVVLTERIREIHRESGASYGMPRVRAELIE